jgi:hypothetical protein
MTSKFRRRLSSHVPGLHAFGLDNIHRLSLDVDDDEVDDPLIK